MSNDSARTKAKIKAAEALIARAWEEEGRGALEMAEAAYREAVTAAPDYWRPAYMLGALLSKKDELTEAHDFLRKAVKLDPGQSAAHFCLGTVLAQMKEYGQATGAFHAATTFEPDNPMHYIALGRVYSLRGDPESAIKAYRSALQIDATDYDTFTAAAELMIDRDQYHELESLAHDFIKVDPRRREAWGYLAACTCSLQRGHVAMVLCNHLECLFPDWWYSHLIKGQTFQKLGDSDGAEKCLEQAKSLNPESPIVHSELGSLKFSDRKMAEAGQHFLDALKLNKEFASAHTGVGFILFGAGRNEEAAVAFERAISCDPLKAEAYCSLGCIHHKRGDDFLALYLLSKALGLNPSLSLGHVGLGDTYVSIGANEEAERAYLEALRYNPVDVFACNRVADLLDRLDRREEAAAYRKRVVGFSEHPSKSVIKGVKAGAQGISDLVNSYRGLVE